MSHESDVDYLARRHAEEVARARDASNPSIAHVHRQLAALYAERLAALSGAPPAPLSGATAGLLPQDGAVAAV